MYNPHRVAHFFLLRMCMDCMWPRILHDRPGETSALQIIFFSPATSCRFCCLLLCQQFTDWASLEQRVPGRPFVLAGAGKCSRRVVLGAGAFIVLWIQVLRTEGTYNASVCILHEANGCTTRAVPLGFVGYTCTLWRIPNDVERVPIALRATSY